MAPVSVSKDTIFVQIATFRDPEYLPTLHSMKSRAAHPENIRVGVCAQYDWDADWEWISLGYPAGLEVDENRFNAVESKGVCWARMQTQSMYQGERFTLQIDSHMRFAANWDLILLEMWRGLKNRKAIISHYAPRYDLSAGRDRKTLSGMGAKNWKNGTLWFDHAPTWSVTELPDRPQPTAFISGHFLFGPSQIITDVPYDPYLERHGEESSVSVRLWTSGYDIYAPNKVIMWHRAAQKRPMDRDVIPGYSKIVELSCQRARALLANEIPKDPEAVIDLEKYGLGTKRSLGEYQAWSGVNFAEQSFTNDASQGIFRPFKRASVRKVT